MIRLRSRFGLRRRVASAQRGAAAIEVALCLPILAVLFTGLRTTAWRSMLLAK